VLSRALRLGGGTSLPGTVARRIAPDVLRTLAAALPDGVVVLSGTNGKTTTTRMISAILEAGGRRVLHNRAGANLVSGLTTTALAQSSLAGRVRADIGLFETDEAAMPAAVAETLPRLVVIHNLFRDQLDRYGEVDTVAQHWRGALATLPATSTVLLNADDPAVADLGEGLAAQVRYYGLDDPAHASGAGGHIADSQFCRRCGARYVYDLAFYAHIGHYHCPRCGHRRPEPHFRLARLMLNGTSSSRLLISYPGGALDLTLPLPGLYNALNALAAASAALLLGAEAAMARAALEDFSAAFGRIERLRAGPGGAEMLIALIKNPVGATETVRMLTPEQQSAGDRPQIADGSTENSSGVSGLRSLHLLIAINDRDADGTDVSWLWDAEFERLAAALPDGGPLVARAVVSGTRADDMAVRLKYAGVDPARISVAPSLAGALDEALAALPPGATLTVLPTYTAMLELRAELARRGWARPFWET
jgi:UDP-N-acetylmuramyl tripeptide synthase